MCATAGVEIQIEPLKSCSLRPARIKRSGSDAIYIYMYIHIHIHIRVYMNI